MLKIQPLNCNVLVKPDEVAQKVGSIYIPESRQSAEKHMQTMGEVVALAPDAFASIDGLPGNGPQVGQRIMYAKYAHKEVKDTDFVLVKDVDVTAVIHD